MKKILLLIVILALVVATASVLLFLDKGEKVAVEKVLPSGPVAYVDVKDLAGKWEDLTSTEFFANLSKIDIIALMKSSGTPAGEIAKAEAVIAQLTAPETHQFIKRFFGKEVALAVYPTQFKDLSLNSLYNIAANVIFVTRLEPKAEFMTFFAGTLGRFSKDIKTEVVQYQGEDIHIISSNDGLIKLGYVRIKDLFVFGFGDKPARKAVDTFLDQGPSLGSDKKFEKAVARRLPDADIMQYVDLETIVSDMKAQILALAGKKVADPQEMKLVEKNVEEGLRNIKGLESMSFSALFADPVRIKFDVLFDRSRMGPDIAKLYSCPAQNNRSLDLVPADVLAYQWSSCFDLDYYWSQSKKEMQQAAASASGAPDPQALIAAFEERLGVSIEQDLLPVVGDEMGGYLKDVKLNGMFPIPQLVFFLEVKDEAKAQQIVTGLIEKQPLFRPQGDEHEGIGIQFVNVPILTDIQPAYAFVDGYLVVTTNKPMIKEAIDVRQGTVPGLKGRAELQEEESEMARNVNSVLFVKTDQLMGRVRQLVDWADKWAQVQVTKQDAFIKGSEQRLADVRQNIDQWYQEINAMEEEIASLKSQQEGDDMTPLERAELSVARTEKFIVKMQEGIDELEKEKKNLEAIEASSAQDLTPAGVERLARVKEELEKKNAKIEELNAELKGLEDERDALAGTGERIQELEKMMEARKRDVRSARESEKELSDIITDYESRRIDPEKRKSVIDHLAKPLIAALSSMDYFVSTARFGDGILESFVHYLVR